jgi:hypothetical protein
MRSCQLSIDPNDGLDDGGSGLFLISFIISWLNYYTFIKFFYIRLHDPCT